MFLSPKTRFDGLAGFVFDIWPAFIDSLGGNSSAYHWIGQLILYWNYEIMQIPKYDY